MTAPRWTVSFVLAGALIAAGCDDPNKPKEPKVNPGPSTPTLPTAEQIKAEAAKGIEAGKVAAADAAAKVKAATPEVIDQAKTTTATVTEAAKTQGSEMMAKLDSAIKENKLDQAQTYLDGLEKIKANLPEDLKSKYESMKTSFAAAKAKAAGALPQLNK